MENTGQIADTANRTTHKDSSAHPSAIKQFIGRSIRKMGYTIEKVTPRTKLVCTNIPGWFSIEEAEALYLLAATTSAPRILEIGHFLGRSTSAICEGIRDAGNTVDFNSYDLGFTSPEEFIAHFDKVHDTVSSQVPKELEELVFSKRKTTSEIAKMNLKRFNLDKFVTLISGDFTKIDTTQYGFIFCDALHDHGEIALNLPHVLAASSDDCLWAFHDMNPSNVADVLRMSPARLISVVDTLGIFRLRKQISR
jgi:predicted O-methyltransferase YrrM